MTSPFIQKAVITGASGFIGQALVSKLIKNGTHVIALCRSKPASMDNLIVADLDKPSALDPYLDSNAVLFHLAASANVGLSVENPRLDFNSNLKNFFEVLESARRSKCKVIFPSTGSVFDPKSPQPVQETSSKKPSSPYGASKLAGEAYATAYANSYGLDIRIARLFSVYGIGMKRFVIYDFVSQILKSPKALPLRGDGNQIRDYLYIEDAVEGLIQIATHGKAGEDYNLASGIPTRILDLAKQIGALMGYPDLKIIPSGEIPVGEVPAWYADISKIKKIGFSPKTSFPEGLKRTVEWLRGNL